MSLHDIDEALLNANPEPQHNTSKRHFRITGSVVRGLRLGLKVNAISASEIVRDTLEAMECDFKSLGDFELSEYVTVSVVSDRIDVVIESDALLNDIEDFRLEHCETFVDIFKQNARDRIEDMQDVSLSDLL